MTAKKVNVQTIGRSREESVVLVLKRYADGWSYEVQDLGSGPLPLPWRTETPDGAEEKLNASYDPEVWTLTVLEEG
ncbi:hypothetical protein DSCA_07810 [Desulfosarcina alkanivorans]|uniref:Uncharacterized protein n=1 Tax=Desulfosarcina alkanivorans TaxID=571177 RepID=A0A5K7YJC2_9BACT|nr:hypothetical protein [Desulfosarcina alkanivorans]BBO66851.1 hypothetical protein DSCA_07810 [Desulfosarcina alkanivorans]